MFIRNLIESTGKILLTTLYRTSTAPRVVQAAMMPRVTSNQAPSPRRNFNSSDPRLLEVKTNESDGDHQNTLKEQTPMRSTSIPEQYREEKVADHRPTVLRSQMQSKSIDEIDDNCVYIIGFARKSILWPFPFTHSSIAFFDTSAKGEEKWLIFGRQTPYFLSFSARRRRNYVGGIGHLLHNLSDSKIDNEKNYDFFKGHEFNVELSTATLSGKEVKEIVKKADKEVCGDHSFDFNLLLSNCYSASTDLLACAIDAIHARQERNLYQHNQNNNSIDSIHLLLNHAKDDNLHLQAGVRTVSIVNEHLQKVEGIIASRKNSKPDVQTSELESKVPFVCENSDAPPPLIKIKLSKNFFNERRENPETPRSSETSEKKDGNVHNSDHENADMPPPLVKFCGTKVFRGSQTPKEESSESPKTENNIPPVIHRVRSLGK